MPLDLSPRQQRLRRGPAVVGDVEAVPAGLQHAALGGQEERGVLGAPRPGTPVAAQGEHRRERHPAERGALAEGSPADGMTCKELDVPTDCTLVAIVRDRHVIAPRGDTPLQAGDEVLALTTLEAEEALKKALTGE